MFTLVWRLKRKLFVYEKNRAPQVFCLAEFEGGGWGMGAGWVRFSFNPPQSTPGDIVITKLRFRVASAMPFGESTTSVEHLDWDNDGWEFSPSALEEGLRSC